VAVQITMWVAFSGKVIWAQRYKTFYGRNSRFFGKMRICPWQAFRINYNASGKGQEPTLDWSRAPEGLFNRVGSCFTNKY
jgi:hypothetical protein